MSEGKELFSTLHVQILVSEICKALVIKTIRKRRYAEKTLISSWSSSMLLISVFIMSHCIRTLVMLI